MFTKGVRINFSEEDNILRQYLEDTVISAHFDEIIITIPIAQKQRYFRINNRNFNIRNIKGYSYFHKETKTVDYGGNKYENWEKWRYTNLETKNPVDVDHNEFYIRVKFHSEHRQVTIKDINEFLTSVSGKYCEFYNHYSLFRKLTVDDLIGNSFVSYIEIALDFIGGDLYFQHREMLKELYKKSERHRKEYDKPNGKSFFRGDYEFFNHPTFYGGKKRSGQQRKGYVKAMKRGKYSEKFFRYEIALRRAYLKTHGIFSVNDIKNFNLMKYWDENYIFLDLDWDRVAKSADGKRMPYIVICTLKDSRSGYTPIEGYKLLSKRLRNRRRYVIPKWNSLSESILEALQQASLALLTDNKQAQGAYQTHQTVTAETIDKILKARDVLTGRGMKLTVRNIRREAGVAHATAFKYRSLYQ